MEENQIIDKKKSKAPIVILLVVLFIIAVAGSSFGGYLFGKNDSKDGKSGSVNVNTNGSTNENVSKDVSEAELQSILYRMKIITNSLYNEFPIKNVDDVSNQGLLKIGLSMISRSESGESVENYIKQVVGYNANVKNENYICTIDNKPLYIYDNDGWYKKSNEYHGHGGSSRYTKVYFRSATLNGDTLIVKTNVIYGESRELGGEGDTFYDGVNKDSKKLFSTTYNELDKKYEEIKDTLPITTYTFKRSNYDGFNLESIIIE